MRSAGFFFRPPAILALVFGAAIAGLLALPLAGTEQRPATITVMREVLARELLAEARYVAFAQRAREDRYPHIARLADALALSESIHVRNCRKILADLGVPSKAEVPAVTVADTRTNINLASSAELDEIDNKYPEFLARVGPEGYRPAIDDLTHSWEAEKQHRKLIERLVGASGALFPLLARTIEGNPRDYFICGNCGSTLFEMPKYHCPICSFPASGYLKLP